MKSDRKERTPLGGLRTKLQAPERKGYVRRWFNDEPGRLSDAEAAGYEFVSEPVQAGDPDVTNVLDPGSRISKTVSREGRKAYLMEIREDWYNEDQAAKEARLKETDDAIRKGSLQGSPGQDGRYVPTNGIKYQP